MKKKKRKGVRDSTKQGWTVSFATYKASDSAVSSQPSLLGKRTGAFWNKKKNILQCLACEGSVLTPGALQAFKRHFGLDNDTAGQTHAKRVLAWKPKQERLKFHQSLRLAEDHNFGIGNGY